MSYNDAWQLHPDGPSPFTIAGIDNGWSGTLSAFDIALLQQRYGVADPYATGNTVYTLKDVQAIGTYYETIWDTGGTDEIRYTGNRDAQIDLTAATLDYSADRRRRRLLRRRHPWRLHHRQRRRHRERAPAATATT